MEKREKDWTNILFLSLTPVIGIFGTLAYSLKFGVQITRSRKDQNNSGANENGTATFNTSAAKTSRNALADVLLGNFQTYTEGQVDTWMWARFSQYELYAQDSWRVNRKLSLELGLRYNIIGPIYSALGNFTTFLPSRFDPAKAPTVLASTGALVPNTGDPYNGIVILGSSFPKAASLERPVLSASWNPLRKSAARSSE